MLCLADLEKRTGRPLTLDDFTAIGLLEAARCAAGPPFFGNCATTAAWA